MADTTQGIYKKLLKFQEKDIKISKDGTNPHFASTFATLNEVLSKVKPELTDLKVLIVQSPEVNGLRTKLIDTDDDSFVECFMVYSETSAAQKLGSNNTYNRRYSLVTLLGLEDEDDDGNAASEPTKRPAFGTPTAPITRTDAEELFGPAPDEEDPFADVQPRTYQLGDRVGSLELTKGGPNSKNPGKYYWKDTNAPAGKNWHSWFENNPNGDPNAKPNFN